MASAAARSFLEVPIQDVARSPLAAGQVLPGLCVFGLLAVLKNRPHGVDAWNNFDKSAKSKGSDGETTLQGAGVEVSHAKVVGHPKARRVVAPAHVPRFLVITSGRQALPALQSSDLERALVARGLASERVQDLLAEQVQGLQARPEDVALLQQTAAVFGRPLVVRHLRVPKRNGEGTVFVMSAIDLVMAAKGCDYAAAKLITWRIFKDYYGMDLDADEHPVGDPVSEVSSCNLTHRVRFYDGERGGGSNSLALDVQGACELLCLIPGSDFGAALRRRAVDTMLRVEGGDTSLLDRIQANRRFQEYLAQHDPDHPLRAIGEHAERRHAEEAVPEAQRREEVELLLAHRKRVLELEFDTLQKKARLETERLGHENARLAAEAAVARAEAQGRQDLLHEGFRRERASTITANFEALRLLRPERGQAPLSPRSVLLVEDELRTALLGRERPDPELGRPLYCSKFLKEQLVLTDHAARDRAKVFGIHVKEAVRAMFPDYNLEARTNRCVDGHERETHLYFEAHLPAFRRALERYTERAAPVRDEELSREGREARRRVQAAPRPLSFVARPSAATALSSEDAPTA